MTVDAPAASALVISPEKRIPPSAIMGMLRSFAMRAQSKIAVICGTPTPDIILVVQIEPGPIPTRSASAPASLRALAASGVAMLPATTSISGHSRLVAINASMTLREWPCAASMHSTSTPALRKAAARSSRSGPTPMAAPTRNRHRVLARKGVAGRLVHILDGDQTSQPVMGIDNWQLLDAMLLKNLLGFLKANSWPCRDHASCHHFAHGPI